MKKTILMISSLLVLALFTVACGSNAPGKDTTETAKTSYTAEEVEAFLIGLPSVEDILRWTDGIVAKALPENIDSEELFETDTKDSQGNALHITHYYEEGTEGIFAESDQYRLSYGSGIAAGPTEIVIAPADQVISAGYERTDGSYALSYAFFYSPDSYQLWDSDGLVLSLAQKEADVETADISLFSDTGKGVIFYKCGGHSLCYTEKDSEHDWYLTTDFYVAFTDQAEAEAYAKAHSLTAASWDYDESLFVVAPGTLTVGLSNEFENLPDLLIDTFDHTDDMAYALTFDQNGKAIDNKSAEFGLPLN